MLRDWEAFVMIEYCIYFDKVLFIAQINCLDNINVFTLHNELMHNLENVEIV